MLKVAHEGTTDVRRARKHTLVSEYEAFRMKNGETISELQTRFTHIVHHLLGHGKMFEDDELNIKILNCLTRTWEPKITVIQQSHAEEIEKKREGIALKVNSSKEDYKESSSDDEDAKNFSVMVKKFGKFFKKS